ncbi:hypothetical protein VIBNIWn13_970001 [Vibrio nigripulchritudo Wn13]|uniref:Uncharacterized protein n=1 Tax=Vibrio nigripulchritudo TaxID=28173 RepID=U4KDB6_9VIBR|nr:hypothetical protein VIBNIBLFn1_1160028 [Vibrio nigripulchritudo BLFn1]CCN96628.1 hypothetical protein VIBNIENn2_780206 [Vibrio nigripulchritudo ENn2]CCO39602.1 hypothetical protein VIBNISFn135_1200055 [Vibrio nigripulchritudo SFn135]CCO55907.1 hypothetical protein VIBNIWn13_970001 [Vibrio nigripulchritudo Wn13]CCO61041.1 hypothetical protein VIBNI_B1280 [Vibrio nigripulchritudo]
MLPILDLEPLDLQIGALSESHLILAEPSIFRLLGYIQSRVTSDTCECVYFCNNCVFRKNMQVVLVGYAIDNARLEPNKRIGFQLQNSVVGRWV